MMIQDVGHENHNKLKKRILYLDCFSGISGDMFLGALIDIGASVETICQGLALLPIHDEYELAIAPLEYSGIKGTSMTIKLKGKTQPAHTHEHEHEHEHEHGRSYADIKLMIEQSSLSERVREIALGVFLTIGQAEAAVHGKSLADVHFHEVGAVDSIVDIVGSALALDDLGIDEIISSPLSDGGGWILCRHGLIPVPVPAVMKMLEGTSIPYRTGTADTELVTPTGMGLIKTLCRQFGPLPNMQVVATGYGYGSRDIGRLNALRVVLGESRDDSDTGQVSEIATERLNTGAAKTDAGYTTGTPCFTEVLLLSCNIDNSTPEHLGYAADQLMKAGAFDVGFIPLMMKKWRPAQMLQIVAPLHLEQELVRLLFKLTGTIGIRRQVCGRHEMQRETLVQETSWGPVHWKKSTWGDLVKMSPEHDDLARIATQSGLSLTELEKSLRESCNWQPERSRPIESD